MTNRLDDVLAAIDAETAKCICGNTIPENGASLDYCSPPCQYRYLASRVGDTPDPEVASSRTTTTDGRAINEEVNRRFQPGADTEDIYSGLMAMVADRLGRAARGFSFPDTRHASTFQRMTDDSPQAVDEVTPPSNLAETIHTTMGIPGEWANPRIEPTRAEPEWIPAEADHERAEAALAPETDGGTRIMFVPNIANPNAPTAAELATGVDLTPFIAADWVNAMHQVASAGRLSLEEAARNLGAALRPAPEPPATGDELRARALEHRHNRGTGPARRDNRRWRNP